MRCCRICGCTDGNCSQCAERTGESCGWAELDLCTACAEVAEVLAAAAEVKELGCQNEDAYFRLGRAVNRLRAVRPEALGG